ncbi:MAG: SCO family protein [Bacteroidota bacterium]
MVLLLWGTACGPVEPSADGLAGTLPYYNEASFSPHWLAADAPELDTFHRIPTFTLLNQRGDTISTATFQDKVYIVDFFFTTCPGICPRMTKNMGTLQAIFADQPQVLLLSHSVTPEMDSVPVLQAYAEKHGVVADKWHLATGERAEIYRLGRQAYFVEENLGLQKSADDFLHTENFVLIDQQRHIRGIYNGLNQSSLAQLTKDVYALLPE